ncbi:MAG: HAD family hydrolase [Waddliaceae bacterium]
MYKSLKLKSMALFALLLSCQESKSSDPLPSWNDTGSKRAIVQFVNKVSTKGSENYVPPDKRIAVFDNDGTLWSEKPAYFQLLFAIDRVKELADQHPDWKTTQPFQAVIEGNLEALSEGGYENLFKLMTETHSGMTTEEFEKMVEKWITTAMHSEKKTLYTDLVYKPMLELISYLQENQFKVYIVSGGGIEFMRVFSERVYGIPRENVIGSSLKTAYESSNGNTKIVRLPEINTINDGKIKPAGINLHIGQRPLMAFGNSDGDFEMLEWAADNSGPSFAGIVHHDDADREWAYDRESKVGRLSKGLDEADSRGWTVISMKRDWKTIY